MVAFREISVAAVRAERASSPFSLPPLPVAVCGADEDVALEVVGNPALADAYKEAIARHGTSAEDLAKPGRIGEGDEGTAQRRTRVLLWSGHLIGSGCPDGDESPRRKSVRLTLRTGKWQGWLAPGRWDAPC
jgi:hypothetical protein